MELKVWSILSELFFLVVDDWLAHMFSLAYLVLKVDYLSLFEGDWFQLEIEDVRNIADQVGKL